MSSLLPLFHAFISRYWRIPRWARLGLSACLGASLTILLFTLHVNAAETVVLYNRDLRTTVPLTELEVFAAEGKASPSLQEFLAQTSAAPTDIQQWLSTAISPGFGAVLPEGFVLNQINKILGEPLGREDLSPLRKALKKAFENDQAFSVLEVLQDYPESTVRLDLTNLGQVYTDISLFVSRLEPVLTIAEKLLPELVCNCTITSTLPPSPPSIDSSGPGLAGSSKSVGVEGTTAYAQARHAIKPLFTEVEERHNPPSDLLLAASHTPNTPAPVLNQNLVFAFGPFRPSISIAELSTFVETGALPPAWRFYFKVAKLDEEGLRKALSQQVKVNVKFLDQILNSLLGEFVLYEAGQILQTPSQLANIQALRSAIILSAVDDNYFSILELLQHYPTQQILVNGNRLVRFGKNASRLASREGQSAAALDIEGWFLQIQASAAEKVCDCEQGTGAAPDLPEVSPVTATTRAEYLPPNWQPVESHREDRGIIKVVWLTGTPYEMGYQHGTLLHNEIATLGERTIRAATFAGKGLAFGRLASKRTYPNVIEECRGLVDATQDLGITMDACLVMAYADVFQEILGYTLPQELFWDGCNQFVATGNATIDGRLYHGSSVDNNKKPVPYVVNNPVVFVRQPNEGLPHVFVTYPGVVWPNSGMNVAGISLGLDTAHPNSPKELSIQGRSNVQIMAQILRNATSFEEARQIMETQPRVRANLIMIADGKSKQAGVFEFTGKSLAVRTLEDSGVLYVTNHFVLEEMYDKQPLPVSPSSATRFKRFQQLMEPDQSTSYYGSIDAPVMAKILRDRVNPYTLEPSPLTVFDDDASPGGNGSLRQAIYEPERLLLWVAAGPPPVPENPFVCFSVGELLGFPNAAPCASPEL